MQTFRMVAVLGLLVTGLVAAQVPSRPKGHVIAVDGEIDLGIAPYIKRVLKQTPAEDLVILQINTFGGRVDAAVQIRDALLQSKAKTVAFVDARAISAGALISLATDTIVMTHGATMGAATPVQLEGGKMAPVEAKVVSYFRKEMKATAEAKGRRGDIAEAMVDPTVEIPGLDGKETTLTLTTTEALRFKVAAFEANSLEELCKKMNCSTADLQHTEPTWAERIARFLSASAVASLLLSLGMLGVMIELWSPGHALAGTLGVICLLLFFFGHYVVELAGWEELLLFAIGCGLVVIEITLFPTHGSLLVFGALAIFASLVMALFNIKDVPFEISWELGWVTHALSVVFGSMLAALVVFAVVVRFLPATPWGKTLVLSQTLGGETAAAPKVENSLENAIGVTITPLRPSGRAEFSGKRHEVVSQGEFIEADQKVRVVEVRLGRIVVKRA